MASAFEPSTRLGFRLAGGGGGEAAERRCLGTEPPCGLWEALQSPCDDVAWESCGCPPVGIHLVVSRKSVSRPLLLAFFRLEATTCTYYLRYHALRGVFIFRIHAPSDTHFHENLPFNWTTPATAPPPMT